MTDIINGIEAVDDLDELEELAARGIQRAANLLPPPPSPVADERPPPSIDPFDQQAHDMLLRSIDQVASDWVAELDHVRKNSEAVEQLVMQRAAKVKADITALYLLGHAALAEAKRGDDVNAKLTGELEKLAEQRV
jgi:hypothetical protein